MRCSCGKGLAYQQCTLIQLQGPDPYQDDMSCPAHVGVAPCNLQIMQCHWLDGSLSRFRFSWVVHECLVDFLTSVFPLISCSRWLYAVCPEGGNAALDQWCEFDGAVLSVSRDTSLLQSASTIQAGQCQSRNIVQYVVGVSVGDTLHLQLLSNLWTPGMFADWTKRSQIGCCIW